MTSGWHAFLVDTNVLIYAIDPRDRPKQAQALKVLGALVAEQHAAISVQCLSEFFSAATRCLPDPLTPEQALDQVQRWRELFQVFDLTSEAVVAGCRAVTAHGFSLWDALIWAVARLNSVPHILTEDAEHGRSVDGVLFLNPFDARFDPAVLAEVRPPA
jgi:predicted nucleic acid-binding protein